VPLEGSLKELSLASIIQLNCTEMNTATVSLTCQDKAGIICFAGGAIVHAAVDDLVGEEAVYELLSWPDGSFVVETGAPPPQRTISASWNSLLLEGIRRIDEGGVLMEEPAEIAPTMEWPEEADNLVTLSHGLRNIVGAEGSVIISRDGIVFASDMEGNPEKEGAIAVFVGNAANELGTAMSLTPFDWGLVTMGKDRMLILERPAFFVGLLLNEKASPALVSAEADKVLG
jgi:predicted regulator of Ras-like GTPase activity (Roadblock/LC7/MglB family)